MSCMALAASSVPGNKSKGADASMGRACMCQLQPGTCHMSSYAFPVGPLNMLRTCSGLSGAVKLATDRSAECILL